MIKSKFISVPIIILMLFFIGCNYKSNTVFSSDPKVNKFAYAGKIVLPDSIPFEVQVNYLNRHDKKESYKTIKEITDTILISSIDSIIDELKSTKIYYCKNAALNEKYEGSPEVLTLIFFYDDYDVTIQIILDDFNVKELDSDFILVKKSSESKIYYISKSDRLGSLIQKFWLNIKDRKELDTKYFR